MSQEEFQLIKRYFVSDTEGDDVLLGIGDDAAVIEMINILYQHAERRFGIRFRQLDRIERFSSRGQRRLPRLANTRFNALLILLMGLVMALPIPFPGTNTFPAWAIVFLATAQAEEDGVLVIWGYASVVITIVYFGLCGKWMWWLTVESYNFLKGIF